MPESLPIDTVKKIGKLARLDVSDAEAAQYAVQLSAILSYVDKLRELNLDGVEPMTSPLDMGSRLDADEPGPMLRNEDLMAIAPQTMPPFIKVPKVLSDEGAA